jgi:hypothetical protein
MQKKNLWILVVTVLLIGGAVRAQDFYVVGAGGNPWMKNGTNIYYNNGNVGIGTTSPGSPLTVQSNSNSAITASSIAGGATVISATIANTTGSGIALSGYTASTDPSSTGVYGFTSGGFGVQGVNQSPSGSGSGVKGSGSYIGTWGETTSADIYSSGVYGTATSGYGVNGQSDNCGVFGQTHSVNNLGVGVLGVAAGDSTGVMGFNLSGPGDALVSRILGTKSAVVHTSKGDRKLYSQESPEVWFEDFGEGKLEGGKARIELDPLFLETVTVNDQNPLKVFIQLKDDCNGVYVRPQVTGFKVKELRNGNSSAAFTYRVVAKRKGFETARLESAGDTPKFASLKTPKK